MAFELDPSVIFSDSIITLHPQRATGFEISLPGAGADELSTYAIPSDGIVVLREAPLQASFTIPTGLTVTYQGSGTPLTETLSAPSVGQFLVNYSNGTVTFNAAEASVAVIITYTGRGSFINARDVNNITYKLFSDQGSGESFFSKLDGLTTNGADFTITGTLTVSDLNISSGVINKQATEVLDLTDNILLLNSGLTDDGAPTSIVGLEVARSVNAQGDPTHPQLVWNEADDAWEFRSTNITYSAGTGLFRVRDRGGIQVTLLNDTEEGTLETALASDGATAAGTIWFNTVDNQFKGWNGSATVVLG